jgi:hypothetical protein
LANHHLQGKGKGGKGTNANGKSRIGGKGGKKDGKKGRNGGKGGKKDGKKGRNGGKGGRKDGKKGRSGGKGIDTHNSYDSFDTVEKNTGKGSQGKGTDNQKKGFHNTEDTVSSLEV